jgi:preprotein translocase subunit SecA
MIWAFKKVFGTRHQREAKKLRPLVAQVNVIEAEYQKLSDDQLRAKTDEFKARLTGKTPLEQKQILEEILPHAFAAVKNACRRLVGREIVVREHGMTWDMIPFDVQLMGGIALHQGRIAEMATGEGKTLVATLPVYLNALTNRGVHVVTVNDYLAARDSEWMGEVYKFLGLTVGCIQHDQTPVVRRQQYTCDVTYGTNSEFGFDYLRDNGMATSAEQQVQRGHYYAIVDEVDSILIDEARVPLIISGPSPVPTSHKYDKFKGAVSELVRNQALLCNRLVTEAKEKLFSKNGEQNPDGELELTSDDHALAEGRRLLYKVKLGMPKNKQLMKMLENPDVIRLLDKAELELMSDTQKEALHQLKEELFFTIDEKGHDTDLTEKGRSFLDPSDPNGYVLPALNDEYAQIDQQTDLNAQQKIEAKQKLQAEFDEKSERIHSIAQLLRAYCLYEKDVEYVVQDNKVIIVDEFTGRLMIGRRWSDGLHQAVEAKEGVAIERETQTLATITIQNYFRLYEKLAGMTGTAETEANEFKDIYKIDVSVIPTNRPCIRKDENDVVYKTRREKYKAILEEIKQRHGQGQPMLVGTVSVEVSELLSRMLKREGIPHAVLNAKFHQQEAEIVARAGQRGAVTIATNMAGRGTDIKLGTGVKDLGGLHVIGTERHESRRIDRQLRGRCARQGDEGSSRFFISLEDDLMRLFGSGRIANIMEKVGMEEGQDLQHPLLNRSIETAQKRVESHNYNIRKRTLEFDDVMNKQREVIYGFRNEMLHTDNPREMLFDLIGEVVEDRVAEYLPDSKNEEKQDVSGLINWLNLSFPIGITKDELPVGEKTSAEIVALILERIETSYKAKESFEDPAAIRMLERYVILSAIDRLWQEHLDNIEALRTGIHLRAYGQRDPLVEYKAEAFKVFDELMSSIKNEIVSNIFRSASSVQAFEKFLTNMPLRFSSPDESVIGATFSGGQSRPAPGQASAAAVRGNGQDAGLVDDAVKAAIAVPIRRDTPKVGRNEDCPCGAKDPKTGRPKKYKHCCGRFQR